MSKDDFGDRMKLYEQAEASRSALPLLPVCARLDGRSFGKFTKGLKRPYDERLTECMVETAKYVVEQSHATIGYTQSDEISLVFITKNYRSQIFFNGKLQKMASVLAAMATAKFNSLLASKIPEKADRLPEFDCRVWAVPNEVEAANVILWRELDATRNSISMAAQSVYSHKELHKKSTADMQEMLFQKGINWNDYPDFFKRGTYIKRETELRKLTTEELAKIPEHVRPTGLVERTELVSFCFSVPLTKVTNRVAALFYNQRAILGAATDSITIQIGDEDEDRRS